MASDGLMSPPWKLFPDLSSGKPQYIAAALEYGDVWMRFFCALSPPDQFKYKQVYPEPEGWTGTYRAILEPDDPDDSAGSGVPAPRRPVLPGIAAARELPDC
jgi:hypothetical protein